MNRFSLFNEIRFVLATFKHKGEINFFKFRYLIVASLIDQGYREMGMRKFSNLISLR